MNLTNLRDEFRTIIELNSSGLPGLLDAEINIFLNNSQLKLINQRLQGHTVDKSKYPETPKRVDDLNDLFKIGTISGAEISESATVNFYDFNLSSLTDYLHFNEATFKVTAPTADIGRYKMKEIPYHLTYKFEYNPTNKPYIENPVYTVINNGSNKIIRTYFDLYRAILGATNWTIELEVGYFKIPTDLLTVSASETLVNFNDDVYREIIKLAVDEAIATIIPQKAQISNEQIIKSE